LNNFGYDEEFSPLLAGKDNLGRPKPGRYRSFVKDCLWRHHTNQIGREAGAAAVAGLAGTGFAKSPEHAAVTSTLAALFGIKAVSGFRSLVYLPAQQAP